MSTAKLIRKRRRYALAGFLLGLVPVAVGTWWDAGHGQAWLSCQTGTDSQRCPLQYGFHSGFGSIILPPLLTLAGAWILLWWHHRCHEPKCFRKGKVTVDDHGTLSCYVHHPDGKPERGHIARKHAEHQKLVSAIRHEVTRREGRTEGR